MGGPGPDRGEMIPDAPPTIAERDMLHALDRAAEMIPDDAPDAARLRYDYARTLAAGWATDRADRGAADRRRGLDRIASPTSPPTPPATSDAPADAATIANLATLSAVDYDRRRVAEAERLGVRVATLDAEVDRLRRPRGQEDPAPNGLLAGWAVTPWPDAVTTAALLDDLTAFYRAHVVLPAHGAVALALWVLNAWAHDAATVSPLLVAASPEKRCGKSTVLLLLRYTAPRPLAAATVTPAVLFRAVERWQPTLLLDEADTYMAGADELRGLLNSGHVRAMAQTIRCVGDEHEPQTFRTWSPKAIACIGRLHDTLIDRAIVLPMRRRLPSETVRRLRGDADGAHADLRSRCARWAADAIHSLREADPPLPNNLGDRAADNWRLLLAIADQAGGTWPTRARQAAVALSGESSTDTDSVLTQFLADVADTLERAGGRLASTVLAARLGEMEERPWPEWHRGQPITPRQVAIMLRPLGVLPTTIRLDADTTAKGYRFDDVALVDALARYLPRRFVTPTQSAPVVAESTLTIRHNSDVLPFVSARKAAPVAVCDAVTAQDGAPPGPAVLG